MTFCLPKHEDKSNASMRGVPLFRQYPVVQEEKGLYISIGGCISATRALCCVAHLQHGPWAKLSWLINPISLHFLPEVAAVDTEGHRRFFDLPASIDQCFEDIVPLKLLAGFAQVGCLSRSRHLL